MAPRDSADQSDRSPASQTHDLSSLFPEDNGTLTREQYLALRDRSPVHNVEVKPQ